MDSDIFSSSDEMDFETQTDILTLLENVKCQSNNSSSQRQAFIALATILNVGEESQNYFRLAGGLEEIKNKLLEDSYEISILPVALFCFACAVKDNVTSKMEALSRDLLLALHQMFASVQNQPCLQAAAFLLACLVTGNLQGQHLAMDTGCVEDLLMILRGLVQDECTDGKQWMTVTRSLCACISNPQNENNQRVSCCVIPYVLKVVSNWSCGEVIQHALTLMGMVMLNNGSNQSRFRSCGGIDTLTNLISKLMTRIIGHDEDQSSILLSTIATLDFAVAENEQNALHAVSLGGIEHILDLFQKYTLLPSDVRFPLLALAHLLEYADLSRDLATKAQGQMIKFLTDSESSQDDELLKVIKYILALCKDKSISKVEDDCQSRHSKTIESKKRHEHKGNSSGYQTRTMEWASSPCKDSSMPQNSQTQSKTDYNTNIHQSQSEVNFETSPQEEMMLNNLRKRRARDMCNMAKSKSYDEDSFHFGKMTARHLGQNSTSGFSNRNRESYDGNGLNIFKDNTMMSQDGLKRGSVLLDDSFKASHHGQRRDMKWRKQNDDVSLSEYDHNSSDAKLSQPGRFHQGLSGSDSGFNIALMAMQEKQIQMFSKIQTMISSIINLVPFLQQEATDLPHLSSSHCPIGNSYQPITSSPKNSVKSLAPPPPPPTISLDLSMIEPDRKGSHYPSASSSHLSLQQSCHLEHNVYSRPTSSSFQYNLPSFSDACSNVLHGKSKRKINPVSEAPVKHISRPPVYSGVERNDHTTNLKSMTSRSLRSNSSFNILKACDTHNAEDKVKDTNEFEVHIDDDDDGGTMVNEDVNTSSSTIEYSSRTHFDRDGILHASNRQTAVNSSMYEKEPDGGRIPRSSSRRSNPSFEEKGRELKSYTPQKRTKPCETHCINVQTLVNQCKKIKRRCLNSESKVSTEQTPDDRVSRKELIENVRKVKSIPSICLSSHADILGEPSSHSLRSTRSNRPSSVMESSMNESFEKAVKALSIGKGKSLTGRKNKGGKKSCVGLNGRNPDQKPTEDRDSGFGGGMEQESDYDVTTNRRQNRNKTDLGENLNGEMKMRRNSSHGKRAQSERKEDIGKSYNRSCLHTPPQSLAYFSLRKSARHSACPASVGDPTLLKRDHRDEVEAEDLKRQKTENMNTPEKQEMVIKEGILTPRLRSDDIEEDVKDVYDLTFNSHFSKGYPSTPGSDVSDKSLQRSLRKKRHSHSTRRLRVPYNDQEILNLRHGVATLGTRWQQIVAVYQFHPSRTAVDLKEKFQRLMNSSKSSSNRKFPALSFSVDEIRRLRRGVKMFGHNWKAILAGEKFLPGRTAQDLRNKWRVLSKDLLNHSI